MKLFFPLSPMEPNVFGILACYYNVGFLKYSIVRPWSPDAGTSARNERLETDGCPQRVSTKCPQRAPKRGPKIRQKYYVCFCFFLVFECIRSGFGGFNYSQTANLDSGTYCNTFKMIAGTSKKSTKSGPSDPVFINKMFQRIQEKLSEHPWKSDNSKIMEGLCT